MRLSNQLAGVPVVILCGGRGVIFNEAPAHRTNKSLIRVQGRPLVYWVMKSYARYGATEFILAAGFESEQFGPALKAQGAQELCGQQGFHALSLGAAKCRVRVVPTEHGASTAGRLLSCRPALEDHGERGCFAVTYSDTLSDVDLGEEMHFHRQQGVIATMVAARLPVRFRVLGIRAGEVLVRGFAARPVIEGPSINGGFYLFETAFWRAASTLSPEVALENAPLEQLAAAGQLAAFAHKGAWQSCDAERDLVELNRIAGRLAD